MASKVAHKPRQLSYIYVYNSLAIQPARWAIVIRGIKGESAGPLIELCETVVGGKTQTSTMFMII